MQNLIEAFVDIDLKKRYTNYINLEINKKLDLYDLIYYSILLRANDEY